MMNVYEVKYKIVNSSEKVLPDIEPRFEVSSGVMLKNQSHHFQIAYNTLFGVRGINLATVTIEGELAPYTTVCVEELTASAFHSRERDDYYITQTSAVLPDALVPLEKVNLPMPYGMWRAIWCTVKLPKNFKAGIYTITAVFRDFECNEIFRVNYDLEVLDAVAPKTDFFATNWMHYDCLSQWHKVKLFGPKFYKIFANYLKTYVDIGFNALLTPLFTPPLDTEVGKERQTAQLVEVEKSENGYSFSFEKLEKFIRFALRRGIKYIELSHLFTQWGGRACPKIMATVNGEYKRIFGWDTDSTGAEYTEFLDAFLPKLVEFITKNGWREITYFHLTDEPGEAHIPAYTECRKLVKKYIGEIPTMDALSHYEFYENGLVDIPVPSIGAFDRFVDKGINPLFVYNCCGPTDRYLSNRFINMPYHRTRVLGIQMYKTEVQGYLHWGYNFYRTFLSKREINPYAVADAYGAYPCGDGFIVYPGDDCVYGSIRACATQEGFQDYDTLVALEKAVGKEEVMRLVDEFGVKDSLEYPRDGRAHVRFMEKVMRLLAKAQK